MVHISEMKVKFNKESISFCISEVLLDWENVEDSDKKPLPFINSAYALLVLPDDILSFLISDVYKTTFYDFGAEKKD